MPRADLDAARSRNQALKQQLTRQTNDFRRYHEQQCSLVNKLLVQQAQLRKLVLGHEDGNNSADDDVESAAAVSREHCISVQYRN